MLLALLGLTSCESTRRAGDLDRAAGSSDDVRLLDAGSGPASVLRYEFEADSVADAEFTYAQKLFIASDGELMEFHGNPRSRIHYRVRASRDGADDIARLSLELTSVELFYDKNTPTPGPQARQDLSGVSGLVEIDSRGRMSDPVLTSTGGATDALAKAALGNLSGEWQRLMVPFPAQKVGIGARWLVTSKSTLSTYDFAITSEYTLRSRKDDRIVLGVRPVAARLDSQRSLPAGSTIRSLEINGDGILDISLTAAVPTSTITTRIDMTSTEPGGDEAAIGVDLNQSMKPAVGR